MASATDNPIYYPPAKFRFQVTFTGGGVSGEASFMEVSGLTMELDDEVIPEGGFLNGVHKVPKGFAQGNTELTLKRGILTNSSLVTWVQNAILSFTFTPIQVQVSLLGETNSPLLTWTFQNVWPKKWEIDSLNSSDNNVAVETLVLAYSYQGTATYS